jgi:hypothetical protein
MTVCAGMLASNDESTVGLRRLRAPCSSTYRKDGDTDLVAARVQQDKDQSAMKEKSFTRP